MKIKRRTLQAKVPSMAMGDIAFNLLIFFVILARATDDSHVQWEPAKSLDLTQAGASKISVIIDVDNKYFINGQQVGIAEIAPKIEEILGNAPSDERVVLLKVHRDANANHFEPVIEAISESGGTIHHVLEPESTRNGN